MRDIVKAVKSNMAKAKATRFKLKYRSSRDPQQSLVVHSKHWQHKRGAYCDLWGPRVIYAVEPLPPELPYDSRLTRNLIGHYYMCIPQPLDYKSENQAPVAQRHSTVAMDPGVRTFMTVFDADGQVTEWGPTDVGQLHRLSRAHAKLQTTWSNKDTRHVSNI